MKKKGKNNNLDKNNKINGFGMSTSKNKLRNKYSVSKLISIEGKKRCYNVGS